MATRSPREHAGPPEHHAIDQYAAGGALTEPRAQSRSDQLFVADRSPQPLVIDAERRTIAELRASVGRQGIQNHRQLGLVDSVVQLELGATFDVEHDLDRVGQPGAAAKTGRARALCRLLRACVRAATNQLALGRVAAPDTDETRARASAPVTGRPFPSAAVHVPSSEAAATGHANTSRAHLRHGAGTAALG